MTKTTKQATEPINSPIKGSQRSSQNAVLPHTSTGLKVFFATTAVAIEWPSDGTQV